LCQTANLYSDAILIDVHIVCLLLFHSHLNLMPIGLRTVRGL